MFSDFPDLLFKPLAFFTYLFKAAGDNHNPLHSGLAACLDNCRHGRRRGCYNCKVNFLGDAGDIRKRALMDQVVGPGAHKECLAPAGEAEIGEKCCFKGSLRVGWAEECNSLGVKHLPDIAHLFFFNPSCLFPHGYALPGGLHLSRVEPLLSGLYQFRLPCFFLHPYRVFDKAKGIECFTYAQTGPAPLAVRGMGIPNETESQVVAKRCAVIYVDLNEAWLFCYIAHRITKQTEGGFTLTLRRS